MKFPLTTEQRDLQARVQTLADGEFRERAAGWDEREEYPWENVKTLVKEGLMGMAIPREYGGQGRALLDVILAIETVARTCGITGRLLVDSNLGPVGGDRPLRERRHKRRSTSPAWSRATSRPSPSPSIARAPPPPTWRRPSRRMVTPGCSTAPSAGSPAPVPRRRTSCSAASTESRARPGSAPSSPRRA